MMCLILGLRNLGLIVAQLALRADATKLYLIGTAHWTAPEVFSLCYINLS